MIKENVISVDMDGTIDHHFDGTKNPYKKMVRDFILRLIRRGYTVYIVTRRYGPDNSVRGLMNEHLKVWEVADELGIPRDRVIFTGREWKYKTIEALGSSIHIDDDETEKYWIERHSPLVQVILLGHNNWMEQLTDIISEHDHLSIWINGHKQRLTRVGIILFILFLTYFLYK